MASGNPSLGNERGEVGQDEGNGGRPPDGVAGTGAGFPSKQDVTMLDSLATKGQSGPPFPTLLVSRDEAIGDQGRMGAKEIVNSVMSFKETLLIHGSPGIGDGSFRETVALGSRFAALAEDFHAGVEVGTESIPVEEDLGVDVSARVEQVGGTGRVPTPPVKVRDAVI
ncbi:hypothetical protein V6N12_055452 [Hibiscus sabdariffa]|uniref:Uncharacterized protein n=1 Tax=Hibiscus sabdariffa TaxID=183260 RepID=A0ABR2BTY8_9ROSI